MSYVLRICMPNAFLAENKKQNQKTRNKTVTKQGIRFLLHRAPALQPTPVCMIEQTMTASLRYLVESTAQYAVSQILAPDKNWHRCALSTSWKPLVLDQRSNQFHRCKISSLMYMFSLDGGRDEDLGLTSSVFQLKLPFWTPNVQFYYQKESPMLSHAQYFNALGTLAWPVFEASQQSCVGVLELTMSLQMVSCAPEVSTPASSLTKGTEGAARIIRTAVHSIEYGMNSISAGQNLNAVASSEITDAREPLKKKYRKKELIDRETLQELFSQTLVGAARSLDVSRSTLKRICRKHGILEWPSLRRNKLKPGESVHSAGECNPTSPSLLPTIALPHQPTSLGSKISELEGEKSKSPRSHKTQVGFGQVRTPDHMPGALVPSHHDLHVQTNVSQAMPNVTATQDMSTVIVKATYREDMIKFQHPLNSGIIELKNEVARKLELKDGTFNIKYEDEDRDWILMVCDADLQDCICLSTSRGINVVRLIVRDKIINSRRPYGRKRLKRKR